MPQLDLFSYFSATTVLIVLFITLIFVLHTYFLPKIATCLKFRKKIQLKQENMVKTVETEKSSSEPFLDIVNKFIIEIEKTVKQLANK